MAERLAQMPRGTFAREVRPERLRDEEPGEAHGPESQQRGEPACHLRHLPRDAVHADPESGHQRDVDRRLRRTAAAFERRPHRARRSARCGHGAGRPPHSLEVRRMAPTPRGRQERRGPGPQPAVVRGSRNHEVDTSRAPPEAERQRLGSGLAAQFRHTVRDLLLCRRLLPPPRAAHVVVHDEALAPLPVRAEVCVVRVLRPRPGERPAARHLQPVVGVVEDDVGVCERPQSGIAPTASASARSPASRQRRLCAGRSARGTRAKSGARPK